MQAELSFRWEHMTEGAFSYVGAQIVSNRWTRIYPAFANSEDLDQLASSEAYWSGSALFAIQKLNLYQQPGSSNLIGWKLEVGVAIYLAWQGLKMLWLNIVIFFLVHSLPMK